MFDFFTTTTTKPSSIPPSPAKLHLTPNELHTYTLPSPSNRTIGFSIYGSQSPSSPTIFLFHGMPGSRICGRSWSSLCTRLGARLITIDRSGIGLSSFAQRGIVDWPEDVLALADHLGVEKFSVVGGSGGGAFALACARFIPAERLRSTTIVCGIGPLDSVIDTMPYLPRFWGATKWIVGLMARWVVLPRIIKPYLTQDPAKLKRVIEDQCTTPEEVAMLSDTSKETNGDDAVVQFLEAFKEGKEGCMQDGECLTREWGFNVANIPAESVWLVHGDKDGVAPVSMAEWIDEKLGGGRLKVVEGATHFTIWGEYEEEVFRRAKEMVDM